MHTANFFSLPKIKSMTIQNVHFINLLDVEYFIINGKSIHKSVGNGVFIKWNSLKIWNSNFYSQKKVAASMDVNYIIWIFVCWMYVCLQKTRHWLSYFIIQSLMILWWDDSRLCWYFYVPIENTISVQYLNNFDYMRSTIQFNIIAAIPISIQCKPFRRIYCIH